MYSVTKVKETLGEVILQNVQFEWSAILRS